MSEFITYFFAILGAGIPLGLGLYIAFRLGGFLEAMFIDFGKWIAKKLAR